MRPIGLSRGRRTGAAVLLLSAAFLGTGLPDADAGSNVGAGTASGRVNFAGDGIPPAGESEDCVATSFSLDADLTMATGLVLNTVLTGYLGDVHLSGSGASECENITGAAGDLTLTATGTGPTGSKITCLTLSGDYTRAGAVVHAVLFGNCTINSFPVSRIRFIADVAFHTVNENGGVSENIRTGDFAGTFTVSPA